MLRLTVKIHEKILISPDIWIEVDTLSSKQTRLIIHAPKRKIKHLQRYGPRPYFSGGNPYANMDRDMAIEEVFNLFKWSDFAKSTVESGKKSIIKVCQNDGIPQEYHQMIIDRIFTHLSINKPENLPVDYGEEA